MDRSMLRNEMLFADMLGIKHPIIWRFTLRSSGRNPVESVLQGGIQGVWISNSLIIHAL